MGTTLEDVKAKLGRMRFGADYDRREAGDRRDWDKVTVSETRVETIDLVLKMLDEVQP